MTGTKFFLSQDGHRGDASVKSYAAAYRNLLHDINIGAEFRTESDRLKTHADCSYHAVRVYHRALTDWELQHNRMIDDVRFRGVIPVTNVVVATSLPGAEGEERSGYYQVGEKYVFTAVPQTVDGRRYRPIGYELEVWNATRGAWDEKTRGCGASYTYETDVAPEKVRLTWLWGDGFLVTIR